MKALEKAMKHLGETVDPTINDMNTMYFYYVDGTITDPHFVKMKELKGGHIFHQMDEIGIPFDSKYIGVAIAYKAMLLRHHSDIDRDAKKTFIESSFGEIAKTIMGNEVEGFDDKTLDEQFKIVWGVVQSVVKPPIEEAPEAFKYSCLGVTVVFRNHTEYNWLRFPDTGTTVFVDHYSVSDVAGFVGGREHMVYYMERNKK
jgi:hypothetical protein